MYQIITSLAAKKCAEKELFFFVEIVLIYKYKVDVCNALIMIGHSLM